MGRSTCRTGATRRSRTAGSRRHDADASKSMSASRRATRAPGCRGHQRRRRGGRRQADARGLRRRGRRAGRDDVAAVTMAGLALVLGCIGVYGVLSFLVSRQTRDLGSVRAGRSAARRVLAGHSEVRVCRRDDHWPRRRRVAPRLTSELYGISPTDPATYRRRRHRGLVRHLTACYVPTRRAMGVDPLVVLRGQ